MIYGHIIDLITQSAIQFQYLSGISNAVSAGYEPVPVPGRSEPHLFYTSTDSDNYPIKIQLSASSEEGDNRTAKDVWAEYNFIKSFQFPDYGFSNYFKPPHMVRIIIGNYFKKNGIIKEPNFDWSNSPVDVDGYPYVMEASFNFIVVNKTPLSYSDIRAGL
jgi:hypothetical protein